MALPAYEDIDLDLDPDEEEALLLAADKDEGTKDEETKDEETKDEETKDEETKDEETKDEETKDDPKPEDELKEEVAETEDSLEDIRLERERLQQQLNDLTVRSAVDGRKLAELERDLAANKAPPTAPAAPVDPGPTPEEILNHLDQRIAVVDAALSKAELEDPSAAPALRQQLRQLDRYYTEYRANTIVEAAKGPDPGELVQQAADEAQQQARFSSVRNAVTDEYPNLNPDGEYFNAELRDMVHEVYNPMLAQGADPTEALIKATTLVMRANGIPSVSEYNQQQAAQQAETKPEEKAPLADATAPAASSRKKEAIERNVAAAAAAAPDISALGDSSKSEGVLGKYDFANMDIKEFMRLTDEDEERIEGALAMYDGT